MTAHSSPSSPTSALQIQMPTVYVVPPEEDQTPTWCCFDANASESPISPLSNLKFLDNRLHRIEEPLPPINSSRAGNREFTGNSPLAEQHPTEEPRPIYRQQIREVGEDSEIIEVVKVGRKGHVDSQEAKRSKGFKHRATKAFRTLRLRRGAKSASHTHDNDQDEFGQSPANPRPSTASLSRRPSLVLAQLFNSKPRASYDQPYGNPGYSSTVPSLNFLNAEYIYPEDESEQYRSVSPSPSTRTFSTMPRFSILNLHKIFSSTPSNPTSPDPYPSGSMSPQSLPSLSQDSSGPSISSGPGTPTEELPEDEDNVEEEGEEDPEDFGTPKVDSPLMQDISFEMRLDSLHFDTLSFNPEDY
ncbi:hypothetical protein BDN72DRAFT_855418 [Pluteus cervinus]|uniref:Uncharacterized protein n=1 Tax=Pluteus cervinus TaxID=181527 RepID=A0ACD3B2Q1_9AGAR|nr:hypothetical protein BDN72DRAFT_855418 [Pluteus cervinus]